jgi:fatty-acyl-CoA synthase/long-chain acyl-CoA synthetase
MDLLATYAASQPDKAAVIDDRPGSPVVQWSFADLDRRANQLAHHLIGLGVDPSTKVVWCGQNSAALLVGVHAIRRVGAVSVPLNYRLAPDETAYVIDNSDARVVYVDADYAGQISQVASRTPKVTDVLVFAADGEGLLEQQLARYRVDAPSLDSRDTPATMTYTSGTTGKPKGAVRSGAVNPSYVAGLVATIGYVPDDIYITTGPLYHSGPGGFANVAQALGNTVVLQHKFDPEDWLRLVDTYRVTTTFTAPTPIRMVCNLPASVKRRYDRSSMRRMIANAAPWTLALKMLYMADFPPESLWEVYGSTELGVDTVLRPEDHLRKPGSCGRPAPGVEIKLFAEDGQEITEAFQMGELYARSGTMFTTYYKAEEKYQAGARGEFHTVGDIAYRDDEGYYYIADRKNDMIISGGANVYPAEVEAVLDASPDVYEVAVFGIPSEEWGEVVHAAVVPARAGVTAEEITAFARDHLAGYKVPRSVSFLEELPKTGSGKVLKRQLKEPFWPVQTPK